MLTTRTLMKNSKKISIHRAVPCPWIGSLNVIKMSVLHHLIHMFNAIHMKTPASDFGDIDRLQVYMERQKTQNSQVNIEEIDQAWGTKLPNLRLIIINTMRY
jgi:hypothetical protein